MRCPNCGVESPGLRCEQCGHDAMRGGDSGSFGWAVFGGIISGIAVGVGYTVMFGNLLFGISLSEGHTPGAHASSEVCGIVYPAVGVAIVLTLVALAAIFPIGGGRLFGLVKSPIGTAFFVAFGITLFCPFLPCDLLFSIPTVSANGACSF